MAADDGSVFASILGPTLRRSDGTTVDTASLAGHCVGLYFSAHWCPPCRQFTPVLASTYAAIRGGGHAFEIVFVSSDQDKGSFEEYLGEMPWLALPWGTGSVQKEMFGVSGIPMLVLLGPSGEVLSRDGRELVARDPSGAAYPWGLELGDVVAGDAAAGLDGDRIAAIVGALDAMEEADGADVHAKITALTKLHKMAANVIAHPLEPKYRSVKKANKVVAAKILAVPHAADVAAALGFVDNGDGKLELTPSEAGWLVLNDAAKYLARVITRMRDDAGPPPPSAAAPAAAPAVSAFGMPTAGTAAAAPPAAAPAAPFGGGMGGLGGLPGMGAGGMPDPAALQAMLANNPALMQQVQAAMANPAMMQQIMAMMQQMGGPGAFGPT